jgi:hypothetical protein
MVLHISEQTMAAFVAQAAQREKQAFFGWWNARRDRLGLISEQDAQTLFAAASAAAADLGIGDNEEQRIFVMAAMMRILPKPTPRQEVLAYDAVFRDASDDERIAELIGLRDGAQ